VQKQSFEKFLLILHSERSASENMTSFRSTIIEMAAHKIIFVSQEIYPYLSETPFASWGRSLPQSIQQRKYEVRTFMPDFGLINERRNQLHEVIRLSGMNIPIGDNDHPLVVKVASMQPSRIQVYFIDNDDYFQKSADDEDAFGTNRPDNDERLIFFTRGTVETARKLRWDPEVMQLSGWMSSLVPLYVKRVFADAPSFAETKLVYTVLDGDRRPASFPVDFFDKLKAEGVADEDIEAIKVLPADSRTLDRIAIMYADAVAFQGPEVDADLKAMCEQRNIPCVHLVGEGDHADRYDELYQSLMDKA